LGSVQQKITIFLNRVVQIWRWESAGSHTNDELHAKGVTSDHFGCCTSSLWAVGMGVIILYINTVL